MNTAWRSPLLAGCLCLMALVLAGCSAGSGKGFGGKAGKQNTLKPDAVITPIDQVAAPDGTLYVRSGAEVLLSAKDSSGGDSAILGITWSPANTAAEGVPMLERGANAMSFRAPLPPDLSPLELRFNLTVRTADGDTASSQIRVLVNRVPDPNDFLLSDVSTGVDAVNLVLVASSYTGASSFNADVPFTINVQKQVRYNRAISTGANPSTNPAADDPLYCASSDPAVTCVKIGAPLQLSGSWKQSTGVSGTALQLLPPLSVTLPLPRDGNLGVPYQNPRFRLRPPALNADEVNFAVLTNGVPTSLNGTGVAPEDARRNNLLYTADIDSAEAEYAVTLTSPDLGATGRRANVLVFAANPGATGALTFLTEGIATTAADPAVATITGTQALDAIKTAPGVVESRDTAKAYYAAIDPPAPGFPDGRKATLDDWMNDNCLQHGLTGAPGYYGSDIHATYLNDRDLGFGREMYFKTDCTPEQRSATSATINTAGGERASIVFNYSSLEGAIKRTGSFLAVAMEYRADANGGVKYTRFYTFAPDPRTRAWKRVASANFDGRRERYTPGNCTVCHGGKPRANYPATGNGAADLGATFVPWDANALLFADTDHSILDDRLRPGFTRAEQLPNIQALNEQGVKPIVNSRIADTQASGDVLTRWNATLDLLDHWYSDPAGYNYVPSGWHGGISLGAPGLTSDTLYSQVISENCRMCHMQRITDPNGTGFVVATAPQFSSFADVDGDNPIETTRLQQKIFQQHLMPASRLTSDRFWVPPGGATPSPAQILASHVGFALPAAIPAVTAAADGPTSIETGTAQADVRLSALKSLLATSYSWTLNKPAGSNAVLVGANTAEPAFHADVSGNYQALLTVTDASGQQDSLDMPFTVVADALPHAANFSVSANSGDAVSIVFSAKGVTLGDGTNALSVSHNLPGTALSYPASCTGTGFVPSSACAITFTAAGGGTINYQFTDADGDTASGTITVSVALPSQWSIATRNLSTSTCAAGLNTNACSTALGISALALAKTALNLTNLTDPQFTAAYSVSVNLVQPTRTGRNGGTGFVSASSTAMSYTPPAYFVSAQNGASLTDTFQFNVTVRNAASPFAVVSQSANGIVNMTVSARASWSSVLSTLQNSTCNSSSCHAPAPTYTDRAWGFAPYVIGTTNYDTYEQLAGVFRTSCPAGDSSTPYCVDFGNPGGSLLLHKPLGEYSHGGAGVWNTTDDASQLTLIENWIRDGAYRN